jgi:hypothetical protein
MTLRYLLFTLFFAISSFAHAQAPGIFGWIKDKESGRPLENVLIVDSAQYQYTYSNKEGYFNMGVSTGRHRIVFAAAGYQIVKQDTGVYGPLLLNATLTELDEFTADTFWNKFHALYDIRMGHTSIAARQVQNMPALLCIPDPVKFAQYLPGVSGGIEGLSGLYIRGGNSDQNLMMMDGLPIYGNGHIFGFLSPFNADLIGNAEFYRGVAPARYGGRAGAVFDVNMKEGSSTEWQSNYSQDILLFNLNANGPLSSDGRVTASFGVRRSWLDLLLPRQEEAQLLYNVHDLNAKIAIRTKKNNKWTVWAYNGRDKALLGSNDEFTDSLNRRITDKFRFEFNWQNTLAGLTYSHKFNDRKFGFFTAGISRSSFNLPFEISRSVITDSSQSSFELLLQSRNIIQDYILKGNMEYRLSGTAQLHYGGEIIMHHFKPGLEIIKFSSSTSSSLDTTFGEINEQNALESAVYAEYDKNLGAGLKLSAGLRLWSFAGRDKFWIRPEPRIMLSQILTGQKAVKLGFSMANQGMHRLSSVNASLPGDVWFPTTGNFKPQQTTQITAGYFQPWRKGWEFSLEGYFRSFNGITDLNGGVIEEVNENYWEQLLSQGKGTAYGFEALLMRKTGRFNGLVSYSWAHSNRTIDDINFGASYPFRWDRRHKFAMQGVYHVNEVYTLNFAVVVMTGNAVTMPTSQYLAIDGTTVLEYTEKNNFRMPLYRRFDVGFSKKIKPYLRRDFDSYWGINIYNLASYRNPLFVRVEQDGGGIPQAYGISYFPIIPSAFYRVKF